MSRFLRALRLPIFAPIALLLLLAGVLAPPAAAQADPPILDLSTYPRDKLRVVGVGASHDFNVWIADTADRQRQGLMYVRDLPASQGMLFVNPTSRVSSFWMKNTYIPLDMLFIDARGRIVEIFANTTPLSLEPVGPAVPVKAILELKGGESAKRGIRKGDRVQHETFSIR